MNRQAMGASRTASRRTGIAGRIARRSRAELEAAHDADHAGDEQERQRKLTGTNRWRGEATGQPATRAGHRREGRPHSRDDGKATMERVGQPAAQVSAAREEFESYENPRIPRDTFKFISLSFHIFPPLWTPLGILGFSQLSDCQNHPLRPEPHRSNPTPPAQPEKERLEWISRKRNRDGWNDGREPR